MLSGSRFVVTLVHGGLEAPEVRLDRRRVLAVLDAFALGAVFRLICDLMLAMVKEAAVGCSGRVL